MLKRSCVAFTLVWLTKIAWADPTVALVTTTTVSNLTTAGISTTTISTTTLSTTTAPTPIIDKENAIRAIHVTAWKAGSPKYRKELNRLFSASIINAVVIDIKEFEGQVYLPGISVAEKARAYESAMPDIAVWLEALKKRGIYTVARIVVFKDNIMPRKNKGIAVRNMHGELWFDRNKITWLDPYNPDAWRYNLLIALQASKLGFDEVQFDYIRFPTDGDLKMMRFSKPYSRDAAAKALVEFLRQARQLLSPLGTKISIDVFGLTTSVNTGMGIGQLLGPMSEQVDIVCPMIYPSHYARGEYGLANPNDVPYKTISYALKDAIKTLGPEGSKKLRPYLQDFSLKGRGIRYGVKEVRAQIQASVDLGIPSWTLWNARCSYTWEALKTPFTPTPPTASAVKTPTLPKPTTNQVLISSTTVSK